MTNSAFKIIPQLAANQSKVETLLDKAFGIDRRTKTSYRLREGQAELPGLSFSAINGDNQIIGTISFWQIYLGITGTKAILLGPLAVDPDFQNLGIGLALMQHGIKAAKSAGHTLVLLVGDAPYYAKPGFKKVPSGQLIMPGPQDVERLLYLELQPGVLSTTSGLIYSPARFTEINKA